MFEVRDISTNSKMNTFDDFEEAKIYSKSLKDLFFNDHTDYCIVKIETVWSTATLDEILKDI